MRIVHLSDIHLSEENKDDLENYFMGSLVNDLEKFHREKQIDLIIISGDLIDQGGKGLSKKDPYQIFVSKFIDPISTALGIHKNRILFVPGNHDVDNAQVKRKDELLLGSPDETNVQSIRELYNKQKTRFEDETVRLKKYKSFERKFHLENERYKYSNFESLFIHEVADLKVGIALLNDSWRCSIKGSPNGLFLGIDQLFNASKYFDSENTNINIAVFHHPLQSFNDDEKDEIENILKSKSFTVVICGHNHKYSTESRISNYGSYITFNGRAAYNNPNEKESIYHPGYNIIDFYDKSSGKVYARKFIKMRGYSFDKDLDSMTNGESSFKIHNENYYTLGSEKHKPNKENLPTSFKADVKRIVSLLIGKSLYPNPLICIRELTQNSVDACNRAKLLNSNSSGNIRISQNISDGYVEIFDEGDGMCIDTLNNHFTIIGNSISQEINSANGYNDLISKFGIGFISVFIVSKKVQIATKYRKSKLISFEIPSVFGDFDYNTNIDCNLLIDKESGTIVRFYLKNEYTGINFIHESFKYLRHIDNTSYYVDNVQLIPPTNIWNTGNNIFLKIIREEGYELYICLSLDSPGHIIASNVGFLITEFSNENIVPRLLPMFIKGEINFQPNTIDLDLSRANIMPTNKALKIKKEIGSNLKPLINEALNLGDYNITQRILPYLYFYISQYDNIAKTVENNYWNFYSKAELIDICINHARFFHRGIEKNLREIFFDLKSSHKNIIYYFQNSPTNETDTIVYQYLYHNSNLVIINQRYNLSFHFDSSNSIDLINALFYIAQSEGIMIKDATQSAGEVFEEMRRIPINIPSELVYTIKNIESTENISISITPFTSSEKAYIKHNQHILINKLYPEYQRIEAFISNKGINQVYIESYLRGLLSLPIRLS